MITLQLWQYREDLDDWVVAEVTGHDPAAAQTDLWIRRTRLKEGGGIGRFETGPCHFCSEPHPGLIVGDFLFGGELIHVAGDWVTLKLTPVSRDMLSKLLPQRAPPRRAPEAAAEVNHEAQLSDEVVNLRRRLLRGGLRVRLEPAFRLADAGGRRDRFRGADEVQEVRMAERVTPWSNVVYVTGDILESPADAVCCPVNLRGAMGAGLALQVARKWPGCVPSYQDDLNASRLKAGSVTSWTRPDGKLVLLAPTKYDYRRPSPLPLVGQTLEAIGRFCEAKALSSVAVPKMGCGLGGLEWSEVHRLTVMAARRCPQVRWDVFGEEMPLFDVTSGHAPGTGRSA